MGLRAFGKAKRWMSPTKSEAAKDILEGAPDVLTTQAKTIRKAAKGLGVDVSLGEMTADDVLKAAEARIPLTKATQKKVSLQRLAREKKLKTEATGLIEGIVPEGDKVAAKNAENIYSGLRDKTLSKDKFQEILNDPILQKNLKAAVTDVDFRMDQFKDGSVGQLNELKKFLDIKIGGQKITGTVNRNLTEARSKLVSAIDESYPDFAKARKISQRIILKRQMIEDLDSIKLQPGLEKPTVSQFYDKLFSTTERKSEFLRAVEAAGGDVQQARNVMKVLSAVNKTTISKLARKDISPKEVQFGGDLTPQALSKIGKFFKGKYNEALLDLSFDPKFESVAKELAKGGGQGGGIC